MNTTVARYIANTQRNGVDYIMYIDGKWMTEPEIKAYVSQIKQEQYTRGFVDGIDATTKECVPEFKALQDSCEASKRKYELLRERLGELLDKS